MAKCVLCRSNECQTSDSNLPWIGIACKQGFRFRLHEEILDLEPKTLDKVLNLVYEKLLQNIENTDRFLTFEHNPSNSDAITGNGIYNMFAYMKNYPDKVVERIDRSLMNLVQKYSTFGTTFYVDHTESRAVFAASDDHGHETVGVFKMLQQSGYIYEIDSGLFSISILGWQKAEELKRISTIENQAFIAMSFKEELNYIREAFKKAILACGYLPVAIDEKEHNNQIVPEIFAEIGRSTFVVVDMTEANNGAYYEAGYAQGLGKQVIVCCKKSVFDGKEGETKPHFDISQKSLVLWESIEELEGKLSKRIKATIQL